MLFYIVCHNEESYQKAFNLSQKIKLYGFNSEIVKIEEHNKYFEAQVFLHLNKTEVREQWTSSPEEFVGILTYSIEEKTGRNIEELLTQIKNAVNMGAEHIPLYSMDFVKRKIDLKVGFIEAATIMHGPYFFLAYSTILSSLGYFESEYLHTDIPSYFCNWWVTKRENMVAYVDFVVKAIDMIEQDSRLQKWLMNHSYYTGKLPKDTLMKIAGKPYYTIHPFLFERLPCFFFHNLKKKHAFILKGIYYFND